MQYPPAARPTLALFVRRSRRPGPRLAWRQELFIPRNRSRLHRCAAGRRGGPRGLRDPPRGGRDATGVCRNGG